MSDKNKTANSVIVPIRMQSRLRDSLKEVAAKNGRSLNAELNRALEMYLIFLNKNPDIYDAQLIEDALVNIHNTVDLLQKLRPKK